MNIKGGTVWSFVDLFLLLCIAFLLAAQVETKESNANDRHIPKIHLFIEQTEGGPATKCNGRYVDDQTLYDIITKAKKKVDSVDVEAMIEENVPYGYVDHIKVIVTGSRQQNLKVSWNTSLMHNFGQ